MLTECKTGRNTHQTLHVFRAWLGIDCLQIALQLLLVLNSAIMVHCRLHKAASKEKAHVCWDVFSVSGSEGDRRRASGQGESGDEWPSSHGIFGGLQARVDAFLLDLLDSRFRNVQLSTPVMLLFFLIIVIKNVNTAYVSLKHSLCEIHRRF